MILCHIHLVLEERLGHCGKLDKKLKSMGYLNLRGPKDILPRSRGSLKFKGGAGTLKDIMVFFRNRIVP